MANDIMHVPCVSRCGSLEEQTPENVGSQTIFFFSIPYLHHLTHFHSWKGMGDKRICGNTLEFSVQKYIRNRHSSSWDKIFFEQCD